MIEEHIRPIFQRLVANPLATYLARHYTANQITCASALIGLCVIPSYVLFGAASATIALLLSGLLDILDGSVARIKNTSSAMGGIYDILADRIVESAAIISLFLAIPESGLACLLMMTSVLLCVSSFLLAAIHTPPSGEKSFHYSAGLMERAEAFIMFILMFWLPEFITPLALLFTALVSATAYIRICEIRAHLHTEDE